MKNNLLILFSFAAITLSCLYSCDSFLADPNLNSGDNEPNDKINYNF
jgi:hypothetical protein